MKLTKVLVGLLAITLCVVANASTTKKAAPKKALVDTRKTDELTGQELYGKFIEFANKKDFNKADEYLVVLRKRPQDFDVYKQSMIYRAPVPEGFTRKDIEAWILEGKAAPKFSEEELEKVETKKPAPEEKKPVSGWDKAWGEKAPEKIDEKSAFASELIGEVDVFDGDAKALATLKAKLEYVNTKFKKDLADLVKAQFEKAVQDSKNLKAKA